MAKRKSPKGQTTV